MNKYNRFWKLLSIIYDIDFISLTSSQKIEELNKLHIGIYDVIYSCDIEGSKDSSIKNVIPADIKKIIKETNVKKIYLNGNKAYTLFLKYFNEYKDMAYPMPSTSPANAKSSIEDLVEKWKVIKNN